MEKKILMIENYYKKHFIIPFYDELEFIKKQLPKKNLSKKIVKSMFMILLDIM
jgi:hypothetical protein